MAGKRPAKGVTHKTGRPTSYTEELGALLCERLMSGESLRSICAEPDMPAASSVFLWLTKHPEFSEQYTHARLLQGETDADAVTDIGRRTLAGEYDPQAARVAIDALKWSASKRAPKKYGDKLAIGGDEDGAPIKAELLVKFV
jgi:hypothetical protein